MTTITKEYKFKASIEDVWDAFVNPEIIEMWDAGPAVMSDKQGSKFSLWGGDIHGTNKSITKHKMIEQDWFGGDWDKPSKVIFEFVESDGIVTVRLIHTEVPESEVKSIDEGWDNYYLGAIQKYFDRKKRGNGDMS
jgi:activator of HSP90 ATPase